MKPAATRGASHMRIFNTALLLLTILMAVMALLPLFGLDLVLMGEGNCAQALMRPTCTSIWCAPLPLPASPAFR